MTRLVVAIGFLLSFGAGLARGLQLNALPSTVSAAPGDPPPPRPSGRRGWFATELGLTPEQQRQLDRIWSETVRRGPSGGDRRRQFREERDRAIAELVPPD